MGPLPDSFSFGNDTQPSILAFGVLPFPAVAWCKLSYLIRDPNSGRRLVVAHGAAVPDPSAAVRLLTSFLPHRLPYTIGDGKAPMTKVTASSCEFRSNGEYTYRAKIAPWGIS